MLSWHFGKRSLILRKSLLLVQTGAHLYRLSRFNVKQRPKLARIREEVWLSCGNEPSKIRVFPLVVGQIMPTTSPLGKGELCNFIETWIRFRQKSEAER